MKKSYVKRWLALSLVCSLSFATVAQADTMKENDSSVQETSESSANDPNVEEQAVITQDTEEPDISGQQDGWYTDPGSRDTYYYEMGAMVTDTVKEIEGNYYSFQSDGKLQKGWVLRAEGWYYADPASGILKTGWKKIKNIWYYLKDNGVMATGWQQVGNTWYYLNGNGAMQTGWLKRGSKWYYLSGSGAMVTGWLKSKNIWYYLKEDGAMATGWQQVGNIWYYLNGNGAMQTGWFKRGSKWYYLSGSGAMVTGWLKSKNIWYYLKEDGAMATGWTKVKNEWYYLNGSGAMQTGSIKLNGTQYDLYKGNARMPVQNGSGLNAFGSYRMTTGSMTEVNSAIQNFTKNGYRVGFCMIDLNSGNGIYYNSNMSFFSASVMKGPYVVSLNERIPNSAKKSEATMRKCIKISDNDAFTELKNTYGNVEYTKWVTEAGCKGINTKWKYIDITSRQLALLWAKNYQFFYSGKTNSDFCRELFVNTLNSPISDTLGKKYTVYSKAGWIGEGGYYNVQNDAGIVMRDGHPYVVVILSTAYDKLDWMSTLTTAIDSVHEEMIQ